MGGSTGVGIIPKKTVFLVHPLIDCSDEKRLSLERRHVFLKLFSVYVCLFVGVVGKKISWEIGCQFRFKSTLCV